MQKLIITAIVEAVQHIVENVIKPNREETFKEVVEKAMTIFVPKVQKILKKVLVEHIDSYRRRLVDISQNKKQDEGELLNFPDQQVRLMLDGSNETTGKFLKDAALLIFSDALTRYGVRIATVAHLADAVENELKLSS